VPRSRPSRPSRAVVLLLPLLSPARADMPTPRRASGIRRSPVPIWLSPGSLSTFLTLAATLLLSLAPPPSRFRRLRAELPPRRRDPAAAGAEPSTRAVPRLRRRLLDLLTPSGGAEELRWRRAMPSPSASAPTNSVVSGEPLQLLSLTRALLSRTVSYAISCLSSLPSSHAVARCRRVRALLVAGELVAEPMASVTFT
jgi:hypothetical protein